MRAARGGRVREWKADGYGAEQCAILLRDRHQSMALENALIDAGIDYRTPPWPAICSATKSCSCAACWP
jgi:superfamily I DNA/RNA helicase